MPSICARLTLGTRLAPRTRLALRERLMLCTVALTAPALQALSILVDGRC